MTGVKRGFALFFSLVVLLAPAQAARAPSAVAAAAAGTARFLLKEVPAPRPGAVGGEWTVLAMERGGFSVPEGYFEGYLLALEETARSCGGVLDGRKYTEYSRTVLALTALGADPRQVGGYDLLAPLGDYDGVVRQGIMGPVMALLALDSGGYEVPAAPEGARQAGRADYVEYILDRQLPDGSFALSGTKGDTDVTAMALQALAGYGAREDASQAAERAVAWLSAEQGPDGGYRGWDTESVESVIQVILALCALELPVEDPRFQKSGGGLLDALLSYRCPEGGFSHVRGGGWDLMATEQALCALTALCRAERGESPLYRMTAPADPRWDLGELWKALLQPDRRRALWARLSRLCRGEERLDRRSAEWLKALLQAVREQKAAG